MTFDERAKSIAGRLRYGCTPEDAQMISDEVRAAVDEAEKALDERWERLNDETIKEAVEEATYLDFSKWPDLETRLNGIAQSANRGQSAKAVKAVLLSLVNQAKAEAFAEGKCIAYEAVAKMMLKDYTEGVMGVTARKTIAVDFDGTIVEHAFPGIGSLKAGAKDALAALHRTYDIVVFSTRPAWGVFNGYPHCFDEMVDFLNTNHIAYTRVARKEDGKILADHYIDDLAIEFKDNWPDIVRRLGSD